MASHRNYTTPTEVQALTGLTGVTDAEITKAEQWIDGYAGFQDRHISDRKIFEVTEVTDGTEFKVAQSHSTDYWKGLRVRVIGGTGAGQDKLVTGSANDGTLDTETFDPILDTTSVVELYQPGKFPRYRDVKSLNNTYFKLIPQAVKEAVGYQIEFMRDKGADFFAGDNDLDLQSEQTGDHQWTRAQGSAGGSLAAYVAPKARELLRGIRSIKGQWK